MDTATRQQIAELLRGREVRSIANADLELREIDGEIRASGYASVTNTPYDMGAYEETISRGAFSKTLSENPDVVLLLNHEGLPLSRTANGTLRLGEDDKGLRFDAVLDPHDPQSSLVRSKIQQGLLSQCSFAFSVKRQTWDEDYTQRSINEVSLHRGDVSVVTYGASPTTSVTARSMFDSLAAMSDEEFEEAREDPSVLTVIRRLGLIEPEIAPAPAEVQEGPSLAYYRAVAQRLALHK